MALYSLSFSGTTPEVIDGSQYAEPIKAIVTGSTAGVKVTEIYIGGEAGSSTVNRLVVNRPSAGGTYSVSVTPAPTNPLSPAATGWTARGQLSGRATASPKPTHATADVLDLAFNAYGGIVRWVAPPNAEIIVVGSTIGYGELAILSSRSGTGVVSGHVIVEQL
jgi:hypothetical protein